MTAFVRMAKIDDRPIVRGQINDYLGELSVLVSGKKTYPYFDDYWRDPTRLPYLVEVGSEPIGFIFVNRWSPSGRSTDYSFAEFYVRPEWRRHGHGLCAASQVLKRHPGQWEGADYISGRSEVPELSDPLCATRKSAEVGQKLPFHLDSELDRMTVVPPHPNAPLAPSGPRGSIFAGGLWEPKGSAGPVGRKGCKGPASARFTVPRQPKQPQAPPAVSLTRWSFCVVALDLHRGLKLLGYVFGVQPKNWSDA
jgi:predicted acetyltransferase